MGRLNIANESVACMDVMMERWDGRQRVRCLGGLDGWNRCQESEQEASMADFDSFFHDIDTIKIMGENGKDDLVSRDGIFI